MRRTLTLIAALTALTLGSATPAAAADDTPMGPKLPPTFGKRVIMMHDRTNGADGFDIAGAVRAWNGALDAYDVGGVRFGYTSRSRCKDGPLVHCVPISAFHQVGGPAGITWRELQRMPWGTNSWPEKIQVNTATPRPCRHMTVIHEMGHVMGLGHNSSKNSIMTRKCEQGRPITTIAETELRPLKAAYGSD